MDEKIRARRRSLNRERGRRRASLVFPLVVLVCAGALFLWLRSSDVFAVRAITVSATERVSEETIAAVTSGVFGQSLLRLSTAEVEKALLELPYVCFAEVHRRFPDTLEINVLEHEPVARVQTEGGGVWLTSDDGRLLEGADASRFTDLPLIVPETAFSPVAGEQAPKEIIAALPIAGLLADEGIGGRLPAVDRINVSAVGEVALSIEGGTQLRLGEPARLEQKLMVVVEILEQCMTDGKALEYVDASIPERVAVKAK